MKSNDEEYLDSLLNSAKQSNNSNPQSALSRMSRKSSTSDSSGMDGAGDISELVNNSNGNQDLDDIGDLLDKLDKDEILDPKMGDLLDSISSPSNPDIPKFTVGSDPSVSDVRDPEEIALDEAIADAERLDAEIQSGKFDEAPVEDIPAPAPIVDIEEGDDALLEMAPEVSLPEENDVPNVKETDSDDNQTPEEILTDLLDDMPGGNLASPEDEASQESLSDVLDNLSLDDMEAAMDGLDGLLSEDEASGAEEPSLEDLMPPGDEAPAEEVPAEDAQPSEEMDLSELGDLGDFNLDGAEDASADSPEEGPSEEAPAEEAPQEEAASEPDPASAEAPASLDELSEDFDLGDLEASLDDLLGGEASDETATEGEVAAIADPEESSAASDGGEPAADEEAVSMPDLDALMNSLASDEIEDLENAANNPQESSGEEDEQEVPKEDILEALTEDGFGDLGAEPSLGDLAAIPDRDQGDDSDGEEDSGKKKKKKKEKKGGFLSRLFKALTEEDEEGQTEGLASLTDENQQVLNELGEDGDGGKKKKKEKKEKKPKKEKPKKEKPPKEKKPPKPKKEKKPKPPKEPAPPEKAISPKKIALCGIFAASLGILVCIPAFILPERIASERASAAYDHQEYTTAYKMLYGKDMTEEQIIMYEQSRVLAWAQRYMDGFENYRAMNMEEEALDMLLMAMRNREDMIEEAAKFNVENQVNSVYDSIVSVLSEDYGLTEADVQEINSIKKDRDYTIRIMEIVGTLES
jgi:hypothetical protein